MTEQAAKDLLIAELLDKRPLRWWDVETIHQHVRLSKTQAHTSNVNDIEDVLNGREEEINSVAGWPDKNAKK